MDVQWHIAFCNVTFTEYVGITYRDYYARPQNTLETQLAAKEIVERKWGVGQFVTPAVDTPSVTFASYLGMPTVETEADELPYLDTRQPLLASPADIAALPPRDPRRSGWMARRWQAWQHYREQGHEARFWGGGGAIVSTAQEISSGDFLFWLTEDPAGAGAVLDAITAADLELRAFDEGLCGPSDAAYTGDDFSGLLSPAMYRRFAIPRYGRIYTGRSDRFMHSELLRADHLRLARDLLDITCFHGAGCENLTLAEMHDIMGEHFWTQITPQELLELSPAQLDEKVTEYANCGCAWVQLYPGRDVPDANMDAAIAALERECAGGPVGEYL